MSGPRRTASTSILALALCACSLAFPVDEYEGPGGRVSCVGCSGPACECAPAAPSDWTHARVLLGATGSDACPTGFSGSLILGQGLKDSSCACRCESPPAGAECGAAQYAATQCGGSSPNVVTTVGCSPLTDAASVRAVRAGGPPCTPSAEADLILEVRALACLDAAPNAAPCGAGSACTPSPAAPFQPAACLVSASPGESPCPVGYGIRYVFQSGFVDTRTCDDAGCECAPQPCDGASFLLCTDAACADCPVTSDGKCASFGGLSALRLIAPGKTTGTCTASGQALTQGGVSASSRTVCCTEKLANLDD